MYVDVYMRRKSGGKWERHSLLLQSLYPGKDLEQIVRQMQWRLWSHESIELWAAWSDGTVIPMK